MSEAAKTCDSRVSEGDAAPVFSVLADGDKTISLSDFSGKNVVLYFYPKDDTPGCTTESKEFRDEIKAFKSCNTVILGVSKDPVKSHDKFKAKYELPFDLLADTELKLCQDYGVWVEKSMYGKKYMGVERSTFLIDGKGVIQNVWRKVKVNGHVAEVLKASVALG